MRQFAGAGIYQTATACQNNGMTHPVILPLWLFVLILLFAVVTFASHFLFPSVRWFFRKRAERIVARLNTRLTRPIEPFKLARRYDMIQRLIYDPEVTAAIVEHARKNKVPENVAFERARDHAREIVPSFSATAYFTFGMRFARWMSKSLYRIRVGSQDQARMDKIDPDAAVVYVMNHRSNMDYVLVTYLVSQTSAMSYAVGEWARVWPLSMIIRSMGAYFIRRKDRSPLYRKVLARYVQMAVQGGVTQAFFPEGGLSLNGGVGDPKLGILSYIVTDFEPGTRDVIFVPVGLNYDRVLEDKFLIKADKAGVRKFRPPLFELLAGLGRHFRRRITGRFKGLGTASVGFGAPLSLSGFLTEHDGAPIEAIAEELMGRVKAVVPVLPVPLVATVLRDGAPRAVSDIHAAVAQLVTQLKQSHVPLPAGDAAALADEGIANLMYREMLSDEKGLINLQDWAVERIEYYAQSIAHHLPEVSGKKSNTQ